MTTTSQQQHEGQTTLWIPKHRVGSLIGKQGRVINSIQEETGTKVKKILSYSL